MKKSCFLFSGQGSQYPGMGRELVSLFPDLGEIYEAGSDILGFDLKAACFDYEAQAQAETEISQPAIMATSLVAFEAVKRLGISMDAVAGHSLGEYAAMTAAGMLGREDAFRVIQARARAMGKCAKRHDGAMAAVMAEVSEIEAVCAETEGYVVPVNYNSPAQTVIAGERAAVEAAMARLAESGKRCVRLAVSAAFHSKFMQPAAEEFKEAIQGISFSTPQVDFYSNVTGQRLTDFSDLPNYLARHLVSPVHFVEELRALQSAGIERFIECGPGKVLTGLCRKTLEGTVNCNVEDEKTFAKLKANME